MKLNIVDNLEIAPDDGISYSVESSVGSLRIPAGSSSATLSLTAYAYKKVGEAARTAYQCYFTVYKRTGATLTYATRGTTKDSSQSLNVGSVASTVDAVVVFITDNQLAANAAAPTAYLAKTEIVVNKDGNNGNNGGNTATIMLFKRSSSAISEVGISATLYYKFSTKKLYSDAACTTEATSTNLNSWSLTIPSGTNDIYVTAAVAFSTSASDDIANTEWVSPVIYGQKGSTGGHGINTATVFLYKRSSSAISAHGISNKLIYKFADGKLYTTSGTESTSENRNGWAYSIPTGSDPCYVIQAAALGTGDYDDIEKSEWSGVKRLVKDGENVIVHALLEHFGRHLVPLLIDKEPGSALCMPNEAVSNHLLTISKSLLHQLVGQREVITVFLRVNDFTLHAVFRHHPTKVLSNQGIVGCLVEADCTRVADALLHRVFGLHLPLVHTYACSPIVLVGLLKRLNFSGLFATQAHHSHQHEGKDFLHISHVINLTAS